MKIFEEMEKRGHEELFFCYNETVDLKAIIALHDTTLGKTLGGLRMSLYPSDREAIHEVLRLSQIMTYQSSTSDIDCGGAAIVLQGNPNQDKNEAYFRALGRFVESLKGTIILSPDLGTEYSDFRYIQRETNYTIYENQISDRSKPSAQITAYGVYWGIKACAKIKFGTSSLAGLTFAVQGLGNVGKELVRYLKQEDTYLYISDLIFDTIKEVQDQYDDLRVIRPDQLIYQEADFLVPCAVGNIISEKILDQLKCKVIAGAAYTIFTDESLIEKAYQKKILYAPDFVISAGDLFHLNNQLKMVDFDNALEGSKIIYQVMLDILQKAEIRGVSPYTVALEIARQRFNQIDRIKDILC